MTRWNIFLKTKNGFLFTAQSNPSIHFAGKTLRGSGDEKHIV